MCYFMQYSVFIKTKKSQLPFAIIKQLCKKAAPMKNFVFLSLLAMLVFSACVPSKKYNELLEREKNCSEELAKYKKSSSDYEVLSKDLQTKYDLAAKEVSRLRGDTNNLGNQIRLLEREQETLEAQYETLENSFDKLKNLSAKETATLQTELEQKTKDKIYTKERNEKISKTRGKGILQYDMWNITELSGLWDWDSLKADIVKYGGLLRL